MSSIATTNQYLFGTSILYTCNCGGYLRLIAFAPVDHRHFGNCALCTTGLVFLNLFKARYYRP